MTNRVVILTLFLAFAANVRTLCWAGPEADLPAATVFVGKAPAPPAARSTYS